MKRNYQIAVTTLAAGLLMSGALVWRLSAAEEKPGPIKEVMQTYHKAPKGTDPTCKKALDGKATAEEIKKLVAAYKVLTTAKPPKGDEASWKEKTSKLFAAAQGLEKSAPDAVAKYKEAVNCKACHTVHRPD